MNIYKITLVEEITGLPKSQIKSYIEHQIIHPFNIDELLFDDEDLTRLRFIRDIVQSCEANLESLEIILNLVDQVHSLQNEIKKLKE